MHKFNKANFIEFTISKFKLLRYKKVRIFYTCIYNNLTENYYVKFLINKISI